MDCRLADATLGIGTQARVFLAILSSLEPPDEAWNDERKWYDTTIETFPFYNCRERGITVVVSRKPFTGPYLMASFFEHRNTDSFCCWLWQADNKPFNGGPTVDDIPESVAPDKYHYSFTTDAFNFYPMVEFFQGKLAEFFTD